MTVTAHGEYEKKKWSYTSVASLDGEIFLEAKVNRYTKRRLEIHDSDCEWQSYDDYEAYWVEDDIVDHHINQKARVTKFMEKLFGADAASIPEPLFVAALFHLAQEHDKSVKTTGMASCFVQGDFGTIPSSNYATIWGREFPALSVECQARFSSCLDLTTVFHTNDLAVNWDMLLLFIKTSPFLTCVKLRSSGKEIWLRKLLLAIASHPRPLEIRIPMSVDWNALLGVLVPVLNETSDMHHEEVEPIYDPVGINQMLPAIPSRLAGLKVDRGLLVIQLGPENELSRDYRLRLALLRTAYSFVTTEELDDFGASLPHTVLDLAKEFLYGVGRVMPAPSKDRSHDLCTLSLVHVWTRVFGYLNRCSIVQVARSGTNLGALAVACDLRQKKFGIPFLGYLDVPKTFQDVLKRWRFVIRANDQKKFQYGDYALVYDTPLYADLEEVGVGRSMGNWIQLEKQHRKYLYS